MKKTGTPRGNASLRVLRAMLGLTQGELAELCEVSRQLIAAVEAGRLPISEKLNLAIIGATGATLMELGANGEMVSVPDGIVKRWVLSAHWMGEENYAAADFARFLRMRKVDQEHGAQIKVFASQLKEMIEELLTTAAHKDCLPQAAMRITQWLRLELRTLGAPSAWLDALSAGALGAELQTNASPPPPPPSSTADSSQKPSAENSRPPEQPGSRPESGQPGT